MRMNRKAALSAGALVGIAFLAACSDSATAPSQPAAFVPKTTSFALGVTNNTPEVGKVKICKTGNIGGSFDVTRTGVGASTGTVSGLNTLIANGTCYTVAEDNGPDGVGSNVSFTEDPAQDVTSSVTGCVFIGGSPAVIDPNPCAFNPASRFINSFHGYVVTVNNNFVPPPPPVCTYTKGWYQNKNGEPTIIAGIDGRSKADQIEIFNASPGQPGDVEWGVGSATDNKPNNLLNLYQQLLAALNNLGGNALGGPNAVDAAIASALAITSGTGTQIFVTPAGVSQISGLIDVLSAFNEGQFANFPHCD